MRILLVRHGESMGNVDISVHEMMADHAIPLSDRGKAQAVQAGEQLGEYLRTRSIVGRFRLWTSPYKRTRQTADGIEQSAERWIRDRREHILLSDYRVD